MAFHAAKDNKSSRIATFAGIFLKPMKNKVVLITGASSGIGKALAKVYASRGFDLVLASRSGIMDDSLKSYPVAVLNLVVDVTKEEDCRNLIDKTVERFGRIDILINNAGISMRALFEEADLEVIRRVMDVNFWGTVYCSKYALPWLLKSGGSLAGVSSVAGYKGLPGRAGYSASKFAMQGLLEVIRIENRKKGLHVLIACPGFTASNIRKVALSRDGSPQGETPLNENALMSAEEVAEKIFIAVKNRKDRIVLTMQGKMTVLLNKFFPGWMDGIVYNHMAKEPDSPFK